MQTIVRVTLTPEQDVALATIRKQVSEAEGKLAEAQKLWRGFLDALVPGAQDARYVKTPNWPNESVLEITALAQRQ